MIRVIYRWRVEPESFEAFRQAWQRATNHIHETVPGALGSFMLRGEEDPSDVLTVARWESRESWKRFWGNRDPGQMRAMRALGTRIDAEVFEEIEDYTR
ncbi:antibiotic biosynthesis monooxygenase [Marinobacter pelagius]|uniref:antibiotic biosynthesis monooxygenase family protein n=1 Tax=Marinobacter sp. C7 TaxID=2951363 RepID=UPI001EF12353|nr:antibiotic biosynthesis monooxygenase [Marinobacter sp. C7]MCG7201215.1 antibiotic biosynthesis monooxygenase [Marinobacter sp. C7]